MSDEIEAVTEQTMPALGLRGMGVNLVFVVLPDLDSVKFFAGLTLSDGKVEPILFADTFDEALNALGAVITGFLALGFVAGQASIKPNYTEESLS